MFSAIVSSVQETFQYDDKSCEIKALHAFSLLTIRFKKANVLIMVMVT